MILMTYDQAMLFIASHPHHAVRRAAWKSPKQFVFYHPGYTRHTPFRSYMGSPYFSKGHDRRGDDWYHCWRGGYEARHPGPVKSPYKDWPEIPGNDDMPGRALSYP